MILPFNLSYLAASVTQVITLFDPLPPFQYTVDTSGDYNIQTQGGMARNTSSNSAGYPASIDALGPGDGIHPLPPNVYGVQLPSAVYGSASGSADLSSVVTINTALVKIEPGFSRIRIDYIDTNTVARTEYFDCPFYEGWNVTGPELENVRQYELEAVSLMENEINVLRTQVNGVVAHDLWRGITVSGELQWQPATTGLLSGPMDGADFAHGMKGAVTDGSLRASAFSAGTGGNSFTQITNAQGALFEIQGNIDANNGIANSVIGIENYYMASAVDNSNGKRCIIFLPLGVFAASSGWYSGPNESFGAESWAFLFTSDNGVDEQVGPTTNQTMVCWTALGGDTGSDNYSATVQVNTAPSIGNYFAIPNSLLLTTGPARYEVTTNAGVLQQGDNAQVGVFAPVTVGSQNDPTYGFAFGPYSFIPSAKYDTVVYNGLNFPRMVWYPPANTTYVSLTEAYAAIATSREFNGHGQGFVRGAHGIITDGTLTLSPGELSPVIYSISPNPACTGETITITGANFDSTYSVNFYNNISGSVAAQNVYITPTAITCTIPPNVGQTNTSVNVVNQYYTVTFAINVDGAASISQFFTNGAATGTSGVGGTSDTITINGAGFGSAPPNGVGVTFTEQGGYNLTQYNASSIAAWSDTSISFICPSLPALTNYTMTVYGACGVTNGQFLCTHGGPGAQYPPTIATITPTDVCLGGQITLQGTNFNGDYQIYFNDMSHPATNVTISSVSVLSATVPLNVPPGPCNLYLQDAYYQIIVPFTVYPQPAIATIIDTVTGETNGGGPNENIQINGTGFGTSGTVVLIDSLQSQYQMIPSTYTDTQINAAVPNDITAGNYQLMVSSNCGSSTVNFNVSHAAQIGTAPILVITPQTVNLTIGQLQTFTAFILKQYETPRDVTNLVTWSVNGVPGGDSIDGTIASNGYYVAPTDYTQATNVTIGASIVYEPVQFDDGYDGLVISATAIANVGVFITESAYAQLSVTSQINIFLGDGRSGYIPVGQTLRAYPGQYVYVQFAETQDPLSKLPLVSNTDVQRLTMMAKTAYANDIASQIYNLTPIGFDSRGNILTMRTIVLGMIDPTDGNWHSMWDIGVSPFDEVNAIDGHMMKSMPPGGYFGDTLPAFNDGHVFDGSFTDYIDNMGKVQKTHLAEISKLNHRRLVGECSINEATHNFSIDTSLIVLGADKKNNYTVLENIAKQSIIVPPNHVLYIEDGKLQVALLGCELGMNAIVVGMTMDRFYTKWPILPSYVFELPEGSL